MKTYALQAVKRDGRGKGPARELRRNGEIPAVIYGDKKEPVTITLNSNIMNVEYNRGGVFSTICEIDVEGEKHQVLARDVQLHPVTDVVEHVDFLRVTAKTKIAVNIPVQFVGEEECPGLNANGTLNVVRFEVELICSATKLPDVIEVSLAGKENGDSINISDATLPEGTKPVISDRDFTIATLIAAKTAEQLAAEDAAEADADAAAAEAAAEGTEGETAAAVEADAAAADAEKAEGGDE